MMDQPTQSNKTLALLPGIGLGDSLLFVPSIHALIQGGYSLKLFSKPLQSLLPPHPNILYLDTYGFTSDPEAPRALLKECALSFVQQGAPSIALMQSLPHQIVGKARWEGLAQGLQIEYDICQRLRLAKSPLQQVRNWLNIAPKELGSDRWIAIHPSSSHSAKNWPLESFKKVAKKLSRLGYRVIFCLGAHENELADRLQGSFESWQGLSLQELAKRLAACELLIGTDSGLGHLASLVGTPTVSIFQSKSHSFLWQPAWSACRCALPLIPLPGFLRRSNLWKYCLLSSQVEKQARLLLENPYVCPLS